MQHYKLFTSAACGDDLALFERLIDDWLVAERPLVQQMTQAAQGTHLTLGLLYVENEPGSSLASDAAAVPDIYEHSLDDADLDPDDLPDTTLPEVELPY